MQMPSSEAIFQYNCQHGTAEGIQVMLSQMLSSDPDSVHYFVNKRNSLRYAPLHTAIFARNLGTCKALLECGEVDLDLKCHGTPILHLVLNTAVLPEGREFGLELFRLLVAQEKIDLSARDDQLATAVHVASEYNLVDCLKVLLSVSEAFDVDAKDRTGMRPLHRAASRDAADAAKFLLASGAAQIDPQTPYGSTPLHVAAASCAPAVWKVLVEAGADPSAPALLDCWGRSPADIVALNGWKLTDKKRAVLVGPGAGAGEKESAAAAAGSGSGSTAIITHPICRRHYTCEPSSTEDPSAPPENVKRLHVVIDEKHGALWGSDLAPSLSWVPQCRPAAMSDVLRVHEWPYVRRIQGFCDSIPSDPEGEGGIGSLDGDTTLCHDSFTAALCAAGAVTHGVDMVCRGQARNAFAPVRPPGHHAGPKGLVKGRDGGPDSHGFCLLNNVSIGAAYALNVHRDTIKRVAIVGQSLPACLPACLFICLLPMLLYAGPPCSPFIPPTLPTQTQPPLQTSTCTTATAPRRRSAGSSPAWRTCPSSTARSSARSPCRATSPGSTRQTRTTCSSSLCTAMGRASRAWSTSCRRRPFTRARARRSFPR